MADTHETKLKKKCIEVLDALGPDCWYFKVLGGPGQKAGVPDLIGCYKGRFFAPELKIAPNKPSGKQLHEIGKIQAADGDSDVIWSIEEFKKFMDRVRERADW